MASAEVMMPAMGALTVFLLVPPALVMFSCTRRVQRARFYGSNTRPFLIGAAAGAATLVFNVIVTLVTLGVFGGQPEFSTLSLVGLALAWVCFWAWVALATVLRRIHRPGSWTDRAA